MRHARGRQIGTAAAFLVLGLLTTIITSWWVAAENTHFGPVRRARTRLAITAPDGQVQLWVVARHASFGRRTYVCRGITDEPRPAAAAGFTPPAWARPRPGDARWPTVTFDGFGWPLVAFSGARSPAAAGPEGTEGYVIVRGWSASSGDVWLPVRPNWAGLAADTFLWCGAWWALLVGPGALKRRRRRRRGLCVRCAYDLARVSGAVCPECGLPLHASDPGSIAPAPTAQP